MKYFHETIIIGVPLYNESQFIRATLDSLLSQTYKNFLVLIADNASDDGSSEICQEFVQKDHRFIYYRHKNNIGSCENFQYIYENTNSTFLMWLGGHDFIAPEYIETLLKILDADQGIALAYSRVTRIDEFENILYESSGGPFVYNDDSRVMRYVKTAITQVNEDTAIHGIFRRSALNGTRWFKFYGPGLFVLTKTQFYGKFYRADNPIYFRREFKYRDTTCMERVYGCQKKRTQTLPNYLPLIYAQISDYISLDITVKEKVTHFPKLFIGLFTTHIIRDLLMRDVSQLIKNNFLGLIPRSLKDNVKGIMKLSHKV